MSARQEHSNNSSQCARLQPPHLQRPVQVLNSRSHVRKAEAEQRTSQANGGLGAVNNMLLYSIPDGRARAGGCARSARPRAAETLWQVWQGFKPRDSFHYRAQKISRRLGMHITWWRPTASIRPQLAMRILMSRRILAQSLQQS